MLFSISSDLRQLEKDLSDIEKKQIPFAASRAINETAEIVKEELIEQLDKDLDRPTPFTKRGFYIRRSSKRDLTAIVGIKDIQAEYLGLQIEGGREKPKGFALITPVNIRLNKYGNLTKGKVKELLEKPGVFSGTVGGVGGIWQKNKRGQLKLLIKYKKEQQYKKRYQFYETAEATAGKHVLKRLRLSLDYALRTAK